jgi:hypothetical protein
MTSPLRRVHVTSYSVTLLVVGVFIAGLWWRNSRIYTSYATIAHKTGGYLR